MNRVNRGVSPSLKRTKVKPRPVFKRGNQFCLWNLLTPLWTSPSRENGGLAPELIEDAAVFEGGGVAHNFLTCG